LIQISNNIKLHLTFDEQISPNGRPIRLSGIAKNLQVPEKYINKSFKNHWIYTFRFLDKDDEFISFEFDYNDKFTKVIKYGKR